MANGRNRKRKRARLLPSKKSKTFKDGGQNAEGDQNPGPSKMKIGDVSGIFRDNICHTDRVEEGTVFMDLFILFGIFNEILKCPDCGDNMTCDVDMKKKNGFSHSIVLRCCSTECEWKYCFHTSKKQGPSYEVNVRAVLAFREIGRGHNAMVTFTKLMNMPSPPTRPNFTKNQNKKYKTIGK